MRASIDSAGRLIVPKAIRDRLGLIAGTAVEVSEYGPGLTVLPIGPTARLVEEDGLLVADTDGPVDRAVVRALLESGRR